MDYFSRYFEVAKLTSTSSEGVIEHFKSIFARHGIPEVVRSDNGPQFASEPFRKFAQDWNFSHVTSSPRFPQSNGGGRRGLYRQSKVSSRSRANPISPSWPTALLHWLMDTVPPSYSWEGKSEPLFLFFHVSSTQLVQTWRISGSQNNDTKINNGETTTADTGHRTCHAYNQVTMCGSETCIREARWFRRRRHRGPTSSRLPRALCVETDFIFHPPLWHLIRPASHLSHRERHPLRWK